MSAPPELLLPRVGLYGGTFDPIHAGHLFAARTALERAGLDALVLVPAALSPHKRSGPAVSDSDRLDLVRAAVACEPRLAVWDVELRRGGVSYTVDTVEEARRLRGPDAPMLALVVGSDNLAALDRWHRAVELLELVRPVVVPRHPRAEVERLLAALDGRLPSSTARRVRDGLVDVDAVHPASATRLREELAHGRCPEGWLPDAVLAIVRERGLYAAGAHGA
ncbi:MAG: nicotinate (nicotinamide) nucleotide adenylyltransferase [Planctomycetota bacterium]